MFQLAQLAYLLDGVVDHSPDKRILGINTLEEAGPDEISLVSDESYVKAALNSRAGALILPADGWGITWSVPAIRVNNPKEAFIKVLEAYKPYKVTLPEIDDRAVVSDRAKIGKMVSIGPFVHIGPGSIIGDGVVLHSGVYIGQEVLVGCASLICANTVIEDRVKIGSRVIIRANSVIGSEGFGFVHSSSGYLRIPHIGSVIIEDEVELGANVTVDAGTCSPTYIGKGTKIGNRTQVSHNVKIGENCLIAGQSGIAGSSRLGDRVIMAGQSGVVEHVKVGSDVTVLARSLVTKDVPDGWCVSGIPAKPHHKQQKISAVINRLPHMYEELKELRRKQCPEVE
jgi:UDP-3-O-[3-hydroxymyristoyl] glucosamine N-acyltransferase